MTQRAKKVAIVQSNYIPWKGYFDLIAAVDTFVLYDEVQYTRRDWRNRNKIKTPKGAEWLTVPVSVKGKYFQKISETKIQGAEWQAAHWNALTLNYRRAPYFEEIANKIEPLYKGARYTHLSELNRAFIGAICDYLQIPTRIVCSSWYDLLEDRSERLADLTAQLGGEVYISGPAARAYLKEAPFTEHGISIEWFDYDGYPEYPQLWGEFVHGVSILDLLFNCGPDAARFMTYGFQKRTGDEQH